MKRTYVFDESQNKFVEVGRRKQVETHGVIQDTMQTIDHPQTGEKFDSKSQYRRRNKELGLFEYGNVTAEELHKHQESRLKEARLAKIESREQREKRVELLRKHFGD